MRVVLDTNVIFSGLLSQAAPPGRLLDAWLEGAFVLVSSEWQLDEIRRVSRYPKLQARLNPHLVGRVTRQIKTKSVLVEISASFDIASDPDDNFVIASALAGEADVLVTGDQGDLLTLGKVRGVPIVSARSFVEQPRL